MPKPIYGEPGSGAHVHLYPVRAGASMFGDASSDTGLSGLATHFIGGILSHAPGLCGLTNPSTSSYRRLIPGFEAPVLVFFSVANRTAAIRIPGYITSPAKMAIEYRIPDATANPYLSLAAVLMAGLDGVLSRTDPGHPMQAGPADRQVGTRVLPTSLAAALKALKSDQEYLTREGVFSPATIARWIELKEIEAEAIARRPHPWEFELYYGC
jgi:glutamine synthetase